MTAYTQPSEWSTLPMQRAEAAVLRSRHRFIDWDEFLKGEVNEHRLISSGLHKGAWDDCPGHKTLMWDLQEALYPLMALPRRYLQEIIDYQPPPPAVDHRHFEMFSRRSPQYFSGMQRGDLASVDIDGAYHQFYKVASLDMSYDGEHFPRVGTVRFLASEELGKYKEVRNAVAGVCKAEHRYVWDHGKVLREWNDGAWQRPDLWGYLQDMLEMIAWDMRINFGAFYVYVDGYVFPHIELAEQAVVYLREKWSVSASIRGTGEGVVTGLNQRQFGDIHDVEDIDGEGYPRSLMNHLGEHVDNMTHFDKRPDLRSWYQDARAYFDETATIACEGLDGQEVPW